MATINDSRENLLPRSARISTRREISALQRRGKKIHCKSFILAYRFNHTANSRVAVTVSKKVDKRAVVRNTVKRRIKEVFRTIRNRLQPGIDLVVIARQSAKDAPFLDYRREIIGALRSHKLLTKGEL